MASGPCLGKVPAQTRANGIDDLDRIALTAGVIQPSNAVEETPKLLPPPALLFTLRGHDHSLPGTTPTWPADAGSDCHDPGTIVVHS